MKKAKYIILFNLICIFSFGQYTDTASMNAIEQNRLANEGDMYLDTNLLIHKIGLTHGKLGWIDDNQLIDSIKNIGDSLFVFIQRGGKFGIHLDSLNTEKSWKGLQYYTWARSISSPPDINFISDLGLSFTQGKITVELNNTTRIALASGSNGYIFYFLGTFDVKTAGSYGFSASSDDGARIYVNNVLVVDNWLINTTTSTQSGSISLSKGEYKVEFWYFTTGTSSNFMEFNWGTNPAGYSGAIKASQFKVK